jgi:hypothetical protein
MEGVMRAVGGMNASVVRLADEIGAGVGRASDSAISNMMKITGAPTARGAGSPPLWRTPHREPPSTAHASIEEERAP